MEFPRDFVWGAAASSYQIEGAAYEDGKGLSVWDMMCRKKGAIKEDATGDAACDHYHRYKEDVALMADIGVKAYRLSLSWPRVLPDGIGRVNEKGLAFYDRLIDAMLGAGIAPYVTLFHWDFPYELYCRGGWLNPASSDWFAEYAALVAARLGDRVAAWMTHNEPQCFIALGHSSGVHAPGDKLGQREVLRAAHNALLAHGKAVQAIRAARNDAVVSYALATVVKMPATPSDADVEAARKAMFSVGPETGHWNDAWWMDPLVFGKYPDDGLEFFGTDVPPFADADMKTIRQPLDFLGLNIYHGRTVEAGPDGKPRELARPVGAPVTAFDWPMTPECLYWGPKYMAERYGLALHITENGMANCDWVDADGAVRDPQRIDYLRRHLRELARAMADGVDVRGYFVWSILDNFEWAEGFTKRFGLVHVDYTTQKRTPKDSALWYKRVVASSGGVL